jgi:hypothetical protein
MAKPRCLKAGIVSGFFAFREMHPLVAGNGRPYNDGRLEMSTHNGEIDANMPVTPEVVGSSPISVATQKPAT